MKNEKNKIIKINTRIIITITLLLVVIISGTFAWFTYSSRKSALVLTIGNINNTRIVLTPYQITETIAPSETYNSGVYSNVEISNNNTNDKQILLYYKVNNISEELINNGLRYTITKSNSKNGIYEEVITKDFSEIKNGVITVLSEKIPTNSTVYYKVYVWLNNEGNQSELQNTNLNIELNGTIPTEPNAPALDEGMIPVKIDNYGNVTTVSSDDPTWYDYSNKEWANIVLVADETRRDYYLSNLSNNVTVTKEDIVEYYVWIPRFKYKIPTNKSCDKIKNPSYEKNPECYGKPYEWLIDKETAAQKVVNANIYDYVDWYCDYNEEDDDFTCTEANKNAFKNILIPQLDSLLETGYIELEDGEVYIDLEYSGLSKTDYKATTFDANKKVYGTFTTADIEFETKEKTLTTGNGAETYRTHQAFWYDKDKDNYTDSNEMLSGIWFAKFETTLEDEDDYDSPAYVLPDKNIGYSDCSGDVTSGSDLGLNLNNIMRDTLDNPEYGAIVFFSRSIYGSGKNPSYNTGGKTGNGSNGKNNYGTGVSDYPQSTTENISGIFDLSGGMSEYVPCPNIEFEENEEDEISSGIMSCNGKICLGYALEEISRGNKYISTSDPGAGACYRDGLGSSIYEVACEYSSTHFIMRNLK